MTPYRPDIFWILDSVCGRREYIKKGTLGQLIGINSAMSFRKYKVAAENPITGQAEMFDNKLNEWVPWDPSRVPTTYSMVPIPRNVTEELDLFIRSAPLVNHVYIWSPEKGKLPRDLFAKLKSTVNQTMIGRFTADPEMPTVHELGKTMTRVIKDFIEQDQEDFIQFI